LEILDLIVSTILPIIDVVLAAGMLYYAYKYLRGTSAIIIFRGFVLIYIIWWITDIANMNILSNILGGFISVGVFALIIVFQQEIRKFLLMLGSNRFTNNKSVIKRLKLLFKISQDQSNINIEELFIAIENLKVSNTGALIVFEKNTSLDFVKTDSDILNAELSSSLIESIFF
jgi:DNA integrity scanning protein DisA with diadenylate cyclase activity